jgi:hypothetical protein
MNERIRIVLLTQRLMTELGVGAYFPLVKSKIMSVEDAKIKRAYDIIREEVRKWP